MDVHPAEATPVQPARVHEVEHLFVLSNRHPGKCGHQAQDLRAIPQVATGQLTEDKAMTEHLLLCQKTRKLVVPSP